MHNNIFLFDTQSSHENLLPLSFTRPVSDFRVGIQTIREKWESLFPGNYEYLPVDYLREKFGKIPSGDDEIILIAGSLLPDPYIIKEINSLEHNQAIMDDDEPVAFKGKYPDFLASNFTIKSTTVEIRRIRYAFDVFLRNDEEIRNDFFRLTAGRKSMPLDGSNTVIGNFIDESGRELLFLIRR